MCIYWGDATVRVYALMMTNSNVHTVTSTSTAAVTNTTKTRKQVGGERQHDMLPSVQ